MSRDLTPEGQKIFEIIDDFDSLHRKGFNSIKEPPPPVADSKYKRELDALRMELVKMMVNSEMVIEDCDTMMEGLETAQDYIKCDARVAKRLHEGLVKRLVRLLAGEPAFEDESHLTLSMEDLRSALTSKKTGGR